MGDMRSEFRWLSMAVGAALAPMLLMTLVRGYEVEPMPTATLDEVREHQDVLDSSSESVVSTALARTVMPGELTERFDREYIVEESGELSSARDPRWWLNSGAYFISRGGYGITVHGRLHDQNPWRLAYSRSNASDTEYGYHPQNIFRMVTKQDWLDPDFAVYARVSSVHNAATLNRNETNGILLMTKYADADNLYYAGVRADGFVVIKKKEDGRYETLAEQKIFYATPEHVETYHSSLPVHEWIGIRSVTETTNDGVAITLYLDPDLSGSWTKVLHAVDSGTGARPPLTARGHVGIRTDFMDMAFDLIRITDLRRDTS